MKIALIADIHSNHYALEACFEYMQKENITSAAFLGDFVSDFPYPQKTLSLIDEFCRSNTAWLVKGNREEYMEDALKGRAQWKKGSQQGSLVYTYNNLTKADIERLSALPKSITVRQEGIPDFSFSHSGFDNTRELIYPWDGTAEAFMKNQPCSFHALGHTHKQFIYYRYEKYLVNPGSVGVPTDGSYNTQMAVIELRGKEWIPYCVNLEYDVEKAVSEFHESGLYDFANVWSRTIIATARTGIHYNEACINLVCKMCEQSGLPFDTEDIWQKAAQELGI